METRRETHGLTRPWFRSDSVDDVGVLTYADTDFANDPFSQKSTSGVWAEVRGPRTQLPLA